MSCRVSVRISVMAIGVLVPVVVCADDRAGQNASSKAKPSAKAENPADEDFTTLDKSAPQAQQGASRQDSDAQLRTLMHRLGIQQAEQEGEKYFAEKGAAARDRDRLPAARRIQPPDAYHTAPAATRRMIDDATRRQFADAGTGGRPGRNRLYYGYGRAGRVGVFSGSNDNNFGAVYAPSSAMALSNNFGAGWSNTAMGSSNFGLAMGSQSSSRLLQGGSPSDLGSQPGSPSSIYTIGSGNTLSGSGAMPGPSGMGVSTGGGTFGINGPMGMAGS